MKKLFNILIFVSFIFLFIYLIRQDLIIPEIPSMKWLIISVFFVFAGFYASTVSWQVALGSHGKKISHRDAMDEGIMNYAMEASLAAYPVTAFSRLWDSINGKRPGCSWKDNPWVWCLTFRRVEK